MSIPTIEDVRRMNYSQLVGLFKERNRPSGGIRTVHTVAVNAFVRPEKRMLEIGSNTGFTCVNMALLSGCECVGIDVTQMSVEEARKYAERNGVSDRARFILADTLEIPFEDGAFDIVWCSNVTSFIQDKKKAVSEYLRVLKHGGTLVVAPIYYIDQPPVELVDKVSEAIGTRIGVWSRQYWVDLFVSIGKECGTHLLNYYEKDYRYLDRGEFLSKFCTLLEEQGGLAEMDMDSRRVAVSRYREFIEIFNENLKYAGYSIFLFQKRQIEEQEELFLTIGA